MVHEALMFTLSIHNNCFHYFDTKDPLLLRFTSVEQVVEGEGRIVVVVVEGEGRVVVVVVEGEGGLW